MKRIVVAVLISFLAVTQAWPQMSVRRRPLAAAAGGSPPAFVQGTSVYANTGLTLTVGAGHLLVALMSSDSTPPATVSDNVNGSWTVLSAHEISAVVSCRIAYFINSAAGSVTVTPGTWTGDAGWSLHEYSGVITGSAFDGEEGLGNSDVTNPTSGSGIVTTNSNDVLVSILADEGNGTEASATNGWTLRTSETSHFHWAYDKVVSSTGTYNLAATRAQSSTALCAAAFKGS